MEEKLVQKHLSDESSPLLADEVRYLFIYLFRIISHEYYIYIIYTPLIFNSTASPSHIHDFFIIVAHIYVHMYVSY